jgi:hypothetical protein
MAIDDNLNSSLSILSDPKRPSTEAQKFISDEVVAQAQKHLYQLLKYFFMVVVGALVAVVFQLNGEIYKAVGETGVSTKAFELEVARLNSEVIELRKNLSQKDCLLDIKVKNKADCYHGN